MVDTIGSHSEDLSRFLKAQENVYQQALNEIRAGRKESHWMWFIFPQLQGLGTSSMAIRYAINSLAEARAYLADPILGQRLLEINEAVNAIQGRSAFEIFGSPDDLKLRSSATLFAEIAPVESCFHRLLDLYFEGDGDPKTLALLKAMSET